MVLIAASFGIYAFSPWSFKIAGLTVKKIEINEPEEEQNDLATILNANKVDKRIAKDTTKAKTTASTKAQMVVAASPAAESTAIVIDEPNREPLDTTKQMILLIGDSMQEGLRFRLQDRKSVV